MSSGNKPSLFVLPALVIADKDLGISPGSVVFKNEMFELIQYKPATQEVYRRPLLLVPPQVNKFYVMDLSPSKSIVRIRQPTLILHGDEDPLVPPVNAKIMHRLIPHSKLYIFHDGHLGLGTSAQELAQVVDQFLSAPSPS